MINLKLISSVVMVCLLVFTGCGSSGTDGAGDSGEVFTGEQVTIDATAGGAFGSGGYTYFDFSENKEVNITDEEAKENLIWDIAFRRDNVILNSGDSGSGIVTGAVTDMQSELYANGELIADKVLLLTADNTLGNFNKADSNVTTFIEDVNTSFIHKGWWCDSDKTANSDNWFIVRSSTGDSYAKMHAIDIGFADEKLTSLQLEMIIQKKDDAEFPDTNITVSINFSDGDTTKYYDFDTEMVVNEGDEWDLKIDNDWSIWTNSDVYGGGQGGSFGTDAGRTLFVTNAMFKNNKGDDLMKYFPDNTTSVFYKYPWSKQKVAGGRDFWSLYRTYIVKVSDIEKYKVQLTNFYLYDPKRSGYITMRYEALTN